MRSWPPYRRAHESYLSSVTLSSHAPGQRRLRGACPTGSVPACADRAFAGQGPGVEPIQAGAGTGRQATDGRDPGGWAVALAGRRDRLRYQLDSLADRRRGSRIGARSCTMYRETRIVRLGQESTPPVGSRRALRGRTAQTDRRNCFIFTMPSGCGWSPRRPPAMVNRDVFSPMTAGVLGAALPGSAASAAPGRPKLSRPWSGGRLNGAGAPFRRRGPR